MRILTEKISDEWVGFLGSPYDVPLYLDDGEELVYVKWSKHKPDEWVFGVSRVSRKREEMDRYELWEHIEEFLGKIRASQEEQFERALNSKGEG